MSADENKALVRRLTEATWNQGNLDAWDQGLADTFTYHYPARPEITSRDAFKQWFTATRSAFPDFHVTLEAAVAEGDTAAVRWAVRGTHQGELEMAQGPIPPTGQQVQVTGMTCFRFADGKVTEIWHYPDDLSILQQLGVLPTAGQASS